MDARPLSGRSYRSSSGAPAAALAGYLLADLGGRVDQVSSRAAAEMHGSEGSGGLLLTAYGKRGPFAAAPAHHSAAEAVGGALIAQYTYAPGPAYLVNPVSTVAHALLATAAVLARGLGGSDLPEAVSALQALFALQSGAYVLGPVENAQRWLTTPRGQLATYASYRAADAWFFIGANTVPFFIKTLGVAGLDDILADPRAHEGPRGFSGTEMESALWDRMAAQISRRPRAAWLRDFEAAGVPAGPVLSVEDAIAHPQITAAGLIEPDHAVGRLVNLVSVERHGDVLPRLPVTRGPRPLSGLRVVELAGYIAGSYVGRLLSDLGADVVKVEPPDGDPFRSLGYGFVAWNHGKRGLSLNLRDAGGRTRLLELVRDADIFVTNYRPDALARMNVGRETLLALNPALIHLTLSAFGESGPLAHLPGFDPVVQAFAGIFQRQGGADEPVKPQIPATDYLSAMLGAIGVLAARTAQLEHGGGAIVRTSLLAAALLLNFHAYEDLRAGRPYTTGGRDFKGPSPLNALHQTADGWLLSVLPGVEAAAVHAGALAYLQDGVRRDCTETAIAHLAALGLPAVPALHPHVLPAEAHCVENLLWMEIEQPDLGRLTLPTPVLGRIGAGTPAPGIGEHNGVEDVWGRVVAARA